MGASPRRDGGIRDLGRPTENPHTGAFSGNLLGELLDTLKVAPIADAEWKIEA